MSYDTWPPEKNYNPPAISDRWQRELVRIAGLTPNGLPKLRLEWGSTCTWTPYVKDLKYLQRRDDRQVGWIVNIKDADTGIVLRTKKFPMSVTAFQFEAYRKNCGPTEVAGLPYPDMETNIEIGIPRWWISQWIPPGLIGPWQEARDRIRSMIKQEADMGPMPREGIYYLGFHPMWDHDGSRKCCAAARERREKCFGYYRPPSDLDLLYVGEIWKQHEKQPVSHNWLEAPDDRAMVRNLNHLVDTHQERSRKEREEMKARIRATFKTHKAQFSSRKGRDTWILTPYDKIMPGTEIGVRQ